MGFDEEDIHFTARDPRGYKVVCLKRRWFGHILRRHEHMEDNEHTAIEAIENPRFNFIYQDKNFENRLVYYKLHESKEFYIKAVVEFGDDVGELITVYETDTPAKNEKLIWPESNQ